MSFERTTPCGVISGTACQWPGIAAYKGIRYATAGRWEFPIPVTHWDGVYDATQYGACCYQPRAFYDEAAAPGKAFYYNEFRKGETYTYSEDCLFLNIWAPAGAAPRTSCRSSSTFTAAALPAAAATRNTSTALSGPPKAAWL